MLNLTETAGNAVEQDFYGKLVAIVSEDRVRRNELLARHTTFRIGGPADYFVCADKEQFASVLALCRNEGMPYFVIGNGSNLLVSDAGIRGVVLRLDRADSILFYPEKDRLTARVGAGMLLSMFAKEAASRGAAGFAFAAGIPGSVGGAVFMNAGAYGGEIKDFLVSVRAVEPGGEIVTLTAGELKLSYRFSILQKEEFYVLDADFSFPLGDAVEECRKIEELAARRREKQPLEYPSAGSTFKRPEGYFSGKLIMDAGLAGLRVGGAKVSEKHCGFIVNDGNATAGDVMGLIAKIQETVQEKYSVFLETEIRMLGEFF